MGKRFQILSKKNYLKNIDKKIPAFAGINGCVVQLDRISDFGSEGWGFESLRGHN